MNILWFCQDFEPSGGVGFVRLVNLLRAQQERGDNITVVCSKSNYYPADSSLWSQIDLKNIRQIVVPENRCIRHSRLQKLRGVFAKSPMLYVYPWAEVALDEAIKKIDPGWADLVCATVPGFENAAPAWIYAKTRNVKLHIDYRDPFCEPRAKTKTCVGSIFNKRLIFAEKRWLKRADVVTVITRDYDWSRSTLEPYAQRLIGLPNGFADAPAVPPPQDFSTCDVNVVFTGKIRDEWMANAFMKLADLFASRMPDRRTCLWLLGMNMSRAQLEGNSLRVLGFCEHSVVEQYQQHADLLLHVLGPNVESRYDSLSGKVWEYVGRTAPVLCISHEGSLAGKLIERESRGRSTACYDLEKAAELGCQLIKNRCKYCGDRSRIQQCYSLDGIRKRYRREILDRLGSA